MALILAALHHGQGTQPNLCAVCSFIGDRSSLSKGNALGKIKYKTLKNVGMMLFYVILCLFYGFEARESGFSSLIFDLSRVN